MKKITTVLAAPERPPRLRLAAVALALAACGGLADRAVAQGVASDRLAAPVRVAEAGPAPLGDAHRVELRSPEPLLLTVRSVDDHLAPASPLTCRTDCVLPLFRGRYRLAPKTGRELDPRPTLWSASFEITSPGALHVLFDDHEELRVAGALTLVGSLIAAGAVIAAAVVRGIIEPWTPPDETVAALVAAATIGGIGLGVGLTLAFSGDGLHVRFEPRSSAGTDEAHRVAGGG